MPVIISRAHKQIVVPDTPKAQALLPDAVRVGPEALMVPHDLRHTLLVRHLGYTCPNPMLWYYAWGTKPPFAIQEKTCDLLTSNPRSYVLNHMGTGKSKTALWSWDYLYSQGLVGKLLVVAPLSTLRFVWGREVFATLPHRKCAILHGTKAVRLARLAEDADIYIVNHDGLKVIAKDIEARPDINALVLDELAVYRNNSNRSVHMRKFATRFATVWGLSGAPMPNAPTDVWAQCKIVTPHTVPKFFKQAQEILMKKLDMYKYVPKPDAVDTAFRWMQPGVRYTLDDVMELPPVVFRNIDVDLSPQQEKVYKTIMNEFAVMVANKQITALNAGAAMSKLLQVATGWVYTRSPDFVEIDSTPRQEALLDLVNAAERKLLVFVPFRHALEGLSKLFEKHNIDHCVVHGQTPNRDHLFNAFQNTPQYKVLLAHPECLAHGLTLTVADTIIWYSPIASLEIYDQANARITRVGQEHKQQVLHLQGTPVEKKIYGLLRSKQKIQTQLLTLFEEASADVR